MATDQEDIAADGDVILIVGNDDDKRRIRVASSILSAASPVLKALLGPHFREGSQPRSSASPVEILMPDDDSTAMTYVCRLIHYKPVDERELEAA
ncbi:hypothetical protein CLAFUW4_10891 [Fulvia fulva]|uniref:BTB domain-containing protein n=1 Tax=Passalora fulva TaxID=5499 RepID=A0A9Q8PDC8_PASFU|nr:uncharacterized protein CLAFUR5_09933 [Fulvia fulva]KAK4620128.1 hypothetical protein CLAFUR4_10896 [Fulvia fulva]KAK4620860.1 hypothetical protein CLAFUR0_10903 [Fulvia fulva]UJO20389.1 hypothetical protein CLAFUR5_09933 [Fulvia fulva]WPV17110.1 hypothetical protein CLAFUW4_10891 [Fulvia fulva]WPV32213.1 hypothetical protein CLAFUW7_10889 [Fulvia fulva]